MSSGQYGRKPIWCDPVDLSLDSDDSDDSDAPLPPPSSPPSLAHMPGYAARPRMYAFPPPPPKSPPPPPAPTLSAAARDALAPSQAAREGVAVATARGQPFRVHPGSSIIFQPDPSSSTSSSGDVSDSSDAGTDRSGSEKLDTLLTAAIAATGLTGVTPATIGSAASSSNSNGSTSAVVPSRFLKRMSSVTLVEDDVEAPNGRRVKPATATASSSMSASTSISSGAGSDSEEKSPVPVRWRSDESALEKENHRSGASLTPTPLGVTETFQYDTDDELRYIREVEGSPIPLNCMTQEKVHHPPRRRPVPSPAAGMRGQQTSSTEYSWKRLGSGATPVLHATKARDGLEPPPAPHSHHCDNDLDADTAPIKRERSALVPSLRTKREAARGTLLVYQPTCLDHHNDTHQENRQRLGVLCGPDGVLHKERFRGLTWANLNELQPARLNDLLRVHSFEYIQHLERACGLLPDQDAAVSVGALYKSGRDRDGTVDGKSLTHSDWLKTDKAKKCYAVENPPSAGSFDMDSPISKSSYLAARLAAGAVCHAIDKVLRQETKNAFVVVRPPGHHAGPNGCVEADTFHRRPEMCTCGFCLLNNVAIGAAYAMSTYAAPYYTPVAITTTTTMTPQRPVKIERIAIVDFDIHHGNGTEDCIRNLVPHKQNYPLPPSWAPLQFSSYKPWRDERDAENVLFASIHLYDDDNFYPCSGSGPHGCSPELRASANIVNMPLDVLGPKYLDERLKLSAKAKKQLMAQASAVFRETVSRRLLPALKRFQPDLILLSAGFDGHADDFYYYLSEDDYGWITEQIVAVADECCDGRVVSVLEGGYNVVPDKSQRPTTKKNAKNSNFHHAAKLHNRELDEELLGFGSLARSCASHVMALQRAGGGRQAP